MEFGVMINSSAGQLVGEVNSNLSDYFCQEKSNHMDNHPGINHAADIDWVKVGERIKSLMEGLKPITITRKIGIHDKTIYSWYKGKKLSIENLVALARAVPRPVSLEWLVTGVEPQYLDELIILPRGEVIDIADLSKDMYGCGLLRRLQPDAKTAAITMMEVLSKQATSNLQLEDEKIYTYDDLIEMLEGLRDKTTSQVKLRLINQVIEMVQRKFGGKSKRMNSR